MRAVNGIASSIIELIPARNKGGPYFIITPSSAGGEGREVTACDIPTFTNSFNPELYFPCHENCVKIVEWIIEARGLQREDGLRRVHDELKKHLEENIKLNSKIEAVTNLGNAGKYGTLGLIQELCWMSYLEGAEKYEADPLDIPDLNSYLEMQLPALSQTPSSQATHTDTMATPTHNLPESLKQMHPILRHLWDFEQVPETDKRRGLVTLMNMIRSVESIEPDGPPEGLPLSMRNQRRIWALVDDLLDAVIGNKKEIE
ncbi:MAG: hypothetical protein Q9204_003922 [Flavoplaca sp. TL-2023a]